METSINTITINGVDSCVMWPGAKDKDGYGFVKIAGKQKRAHRVALEKKLGRLLDSKEQAMHLCNNPSCVNPDHLEAGTNKNNQHYRRLRESSLAKDILKIDVYGTIGELRMLNKAALKQLEENK